LVARLKFRESRLETLFGLGQQFGLFGFSFSKRLVAGFLSRSNFLLLAGVDDLGLLPAPLLGFLPCEHFELPRGGD
jgi:hypothetical protein